MSAQFNCSIEYIFRLVTHGAFCIKMRGVFYPYGGWEVSNKRFLRSLGQKKWLKSHFFSTFERYSRWIGILVVEISFQEKPQPKTHSRNYNSQFLPQTIIISESKVSALKNSKKIIEKKTSLKITSTNDWMRNIQISYNIFNWI